MTENETRLHAHIDVNGTNRVGSYCTTANTLRRILGPPTIDEESGDGKVTMEWYFDTPAGPATLYDFKWDAAGNPDYSESWSIGGHDESVVPYVKNFIRMCEAEYMASLKGAK